MRSLSLVVIAVVLVLASCAEAQEQPTAEPPVEAEPAEAEPAEAEPAEAEPAEAEPALLAAGESFGMCMRYCQSTLTFGEPVTYTSVDKGRDGTQLPMVVSRGQLTDEGAVVLADIAAALEQFRESTTLGCPDCADGGAGTLTLRHRDGTIVSISYDISDGTLPADVTAPLADFKLALRACQPNELVVPEPECQPQR